MAKKLILGTVIASILGSILAIEGGYVNHPDDPGGETNYGITKATARSYGYNGPMKELPKDLAKQIYKDWYITKPKLDKILEMSPAIGHKVIDTGVNTGTGKAIKWLQHALNILSRNGKDYPKVSEDGSIGPQTINAMQNLQKKRGTVTSCELVLKLLDMQQAEHYVNLNKDAFIIGWLHGRIENVPLSYCADYKVSPDVLFEATANQQ